jgi:hypothetical protein
VPGALSACAAAAVPVWVTVVIEAVLPGGHAAARRMKWNKSNATKWIEMK